MRGNPGQPRKGRPRKPRSPEQDKDPEFMTTTVNAPIKILNQLIAAEIPYQEAFLTGAAVMLSKFAERTLADVERDLEKLDMVFLEYLEQKQRLLEEREKLKSQEIESLENNNFNEGSGLDSETLSTNPYKE